MTRVLYNPKQYFSCNVQIKPAIQAKLVPLIPGRHTTVVFYSHDRIVTRMSCYCILMCIFYCATVGTANDNKLPNTSHWAIHSRFNLISTIEVVKYKSTLTGFTIVLTRVESPIVHGYFCLATEAADNDGLPHTLEHLIFLGSEEYPYR